MILADNHCLCSDEKCFNEYFATMCEESSPIPEDDGSGGDITIPTMLMRRRDADAIKEILRKNQSVQVEMSWSLSPAQSEGTGQLLEG